MPDTVSIQYGGRTLRADLVTQVLTPETAQLYAAELDTDGGIVPVWKAHSYTYDGSNNLATDTVVDGAATWVRSYVWANGAQTSDSGWVKQNG